MRRFFARALRASKRTGRIPRSRKPALPQATLEVRALLSTAYVQTNIISDQAGVAAHTDPNLVNPWGISFEAGQPFWFSDNGTGKSTVVDGSGNLQPPNVITIPGLGGQVSAPAGTVFNSSAGFPVSEGGNSGASLFLFATEEGTIAGWNPSVDPNAVIAVNHSATGASYKGLALGNNASGEDLFAANFGNGTIDAFNANFQPATLQGSFSDPSLPSGYAPFNVQNLGGNLYVSYALQDIYKNNVFGQGDGYVDEFNTEGVFMRRVASQGTLNAPWGMAIAPATFGQFANDLLVGNFGDGRINAFDPSNGNFLGPLTGTNGQPITIDGLWSLTVGGGSLSGSPNTVYFTAGPDHETHGLFGALDPSSTPPPPPPPPPTGPGPLSVQGTTITAKAGQTFQRTVATFTEANTKARNFRVTINWGDASRNSAAKVKMLPGGHFSAIGNHRFRNTGTYTVTITVSDKSGHVVSATSTADVVTAPKRGHR